MNRESESNTLKLTDSFIDDYDKLFWMQDAVEIALFLLERNITGTRENTDSCPISNYLTINNKDLWIETRPDSIIVTWHQGGNTYKSEYLTVTPAMEDFIYRFDNGEFEYLDNDPNCQFGE